MLYAQQNKVMPEPIPLSFQFKNMYPKIILYFPSWGYPSSPTRVLGFMLALGGVLVSLSSLEFFLFSPFEKKNHATFINGFLWGYFPPYKWSYGPLLLTSFWVPSPGKGAIPQGKLCVSTVKVISKSFVTLQMFFEALLAPTGKGGRWDSKYPLVNHV